ncbi:MAG TPA: NADH-quinone oxidoreductase subunit C [Deltaproteobacteria bacterium]|nr:NADH-quinone oxidoreductase subunit C [Deltaproteobacteria bacterium]
MVKNSNELFIQRLRERFGTAVLDTVIFRDELTCTVRKDAIVDVCRFVKEDPAFNMKFLSDILGVDYPEESPRFEVIYHVLSITKRARLRLKIRVEDGETVPSVTGVWKSANWHEREVYDMFGIVFTGHPNLKRIYLPDDWEGFPLRKDYPLRGYKDEYNPYGEEKE